MQINDTVFSLEHFEELEFSQGKISMAKNVKFLRCKVSPGTCTINQGAHLENIVFDNLDCGDALRISSDAYLKEVTIRGARPKSLLVQPDKVAGNRKQNGIALDITDFMGEVCAIGLGMDSIRFNKHLHVGVKASWRQEVNWDELEIGPFSFWRLFLKKLEVFGAHDGVFSLPSRRHKKFSVTLDEMRKLIAFGLDLELPSTA